MPGDYAALRKARPNLTYSCDERGMESGLSCTDGKHHIEAQRNCLKNPYLLSVSYFISFHAITAMAWCWDSG